MSNALSMERNNEHDCIMESSGEDLSYYYDSYLNYPVDDSISIMNSDIKDFILKESYIDEVTGRITMPCIWHDNLKHLIANNFKLSERILYSNIKRLQKSPEKLKLYDNVIRDQLKDNIIRKIDPTSSFLSHPDVAFLAHTGIFKIGSDATTKCRIVYMSNLSQKGIAQLSHNDASKPGANLNDNLNFALTLLRFDRYLLVFDLVKAFLQIQIREQDQNKLMFLWVKDITAKRLEIQVYSFLRLPFGLRFSPALLMMTLYIILIRDTDDDSHLIKELKKCFYHLSYMDNIAFTCNSRNELVNSYNYSKEIFGAYKFELQKFATNEQSVQSHIDTNNSCKEPDVTNLFGIRWNRVNDKFCNPVLKLDPTARTKRSVLASIHENFDPLGSSIPLLNRARLYLHGLQVDKDLGWDTILNKNSFREWRKICLQINNIKENIDIPRFVGKRNDTFNLLCFVDSSKLFYGFVIYIQEVKSSNLTFLMAKNRIINKKLSTKSIPLLELTSIELGVRTMSNLCKQFNDAVIPIEINNMVLYSDSTISLSWIKAKVHDFSKIERKNIYLNNRLSRIVEDCERKQILFKHVVGLVNPSDFVTRTVSHKMLVKSNFLSGPTNDQLFGNDGKNTWLFYVPNPITVKKDIHVNVSQMNLPLECIIKLNDMTSFQKTTKVVSYVICFIRKLKLNVFKRNPNKFKDFNNNYKLNINEQAINYIVRSSQRIAYEEIFYFFEHQNTKPLPIVTQLNLFIDDNGLIRVDSKMKRLRAKFKQRCPLLLDRNSSVAKSIIRDAHINLLHAGIYKVLNVIRYDFWIPRLYSSVKKILQQCLVCKRMYGRSIITNQNAYKSYRVNPENIPYRNIILDYMGPFKVKGSNSVDNKIYILIISCYWTRAVNLIICDQMDTGTFIRAIQMHIFEYGVPSIITSDNGSQIVQGLALVKDILKEPETANFLKENNIGTLLFQPYPSGASELGGCIEAMVKQTKILINNSCRSQTLHFRDFEFLINKIKMLINKRPIAYKSNLSSDNINHEFPECLTPEHLVKGYAVPSLSILPRLLVEDEDSNFYIKEDSEKVWDKVFKSHKKMQKVRKRLHTIYIPEFLSNLNSQATNKPNRYTSKKHVKLKLGDLVSIKESFTKPYKFPLAIVVGLEENSLGEINTAIVRLANKQKIRRHTKDLILILEGAISDIPTNIDEIDIENDLTLDRVSKRTAALNCKRKNTQLASNDLV